MTAGRTGEVLRVLQFTDTHFFEDSSRKLLGVDTAASFADVYKTALGRHGTPDLFIFTGDLSQDETDASYERLCEKMSGAGAPCYFIPGNHDRRDSLNRVLLKAGSPFQSSRQIIRGKWQIILLDSLVEGAVGGHLKKSEFDFLESCLKEQPELFALVCLHHHPLPMGVRWLDAIGTSNGSELMEIIEKQENVRGVLWGHVHQQYDAMHGKVLLMSTPSTCVQFKHSQDFGVDPVPPGCRLLKLHADGSIESEVMRTDNVASGLELKSAGY